MSSTFEHRARVPFSVEVADPHTGLLKTKHCGYGILTRFGNAEVDVYPVGVLCKAIDRRRNTIDKWQLVKPRIFFRVGEDMKLEAMSAVFAIIPPATYTIPESKTKRWYSGAQISTIRKVLIAHDVTKGSVHIDWWSVATEIEEAFKT